MSTFINMKLNCDKQRKKSLLLSLTSSHIMKRQSYLEISSVVLIPVSLCALLQGNKHETSEVGRAGRTQNHWTEENIGN